MTENKAEMEERAGREREEKGCVKGGTTEESGWGGRRCERYDRRQRWRRDMKGEEGREDGVWK